MLVRIKNLPAHVLGIRASGKVTRADMERVLLPALDQMVERTGQLNYLLVLDTDVQNFTAGAWWKDMIAGLKHFTRWNRIAVVSMQKGVEIFTDLFQLAVPGKSKGFNRNQYEQAISWVMSEQDEIGYKPISPKWHAILDYALVGSLIAIPALLKLNKKARLIYAAEAGILLPYVALTQQPGAVKGLIPFQTHGKIDSFNIAQFAGQSLLPAFRKERRALLFNIAFTAAAGLTVLLTNFKANR